MTRGPPTSGRIAMIAKSGVTRRRARCTAVRPAAGLLAAGAVLTALAGCGGGPQRASTPAGGQSSSSSQSGGQTGSETAAQAIQAAADQSKKINSYSIRMDESLTGATAEHITGNMQF